ncbi:MAG: choice-of-anchor A family protein [Methylomonas sp.]
MVLSRRIPQIAFFISSLVFSAQTSALSLDLGIAGQFNAFVLGDMSASHSDVEGRLAVGGNLTLDHYAVGMQLDNSHGTRDDLVVGGDLSFSDGRIYNGNARSGGAASIAESVGFYSGEDSSIRNGSYQAGNPVDFQQVGHELIEKSSSWGGLSANGLTELNDWGGLRLSGSDRNLNIFSLSAEQLMKTSLFWLDTPENAWTLVNVVGKNVTMKEFGFYRTVAGQQERIPDNAPPQRHDGSWTQNILFNLVDADFLEVHAIGIKGSILAPLADTVFYNGHIDGNLIVGGLQGKNGEFTGQVNDYPFLAMAQGTPAEVPEPPELCLFATLLFGLVFQLRFNGQRRVA